HRPRNPALCWRRAYRARRPAIDRLSHLVRKTNAATFLGQVQNNATTDAFQVRERELKLVAAVASSRAKNVACQACRMKPNRDRLIKIRVANDDGDLIDAESVTIHNKSGRSARCERN